MLALVQLEHRLARLEVVPHKETCLLELGQHAVDRGEADVEVFAHEQHRGAEQRNADRPEVERPRELRFVGRVARFAA